MGGGAVFSSYVENELIPRLHGMEIRIASYAMCFAKIDMILKQLKYKPTKKAPRISVYLTDSLAEGSPAIRDHGFAQWFAQEAIGAHSIKANLPIMCVIGNPPYNADSGPSKGWIGNLMDDYKMDPNGRGKMRDLKWINDLYVRFIRLSSHFIEKKGEGVMGLITSHAYIDNPTFRGMRWHMLKTFDYIWILDLHGSLKKTEIPPSGYENENVFGIKPGVAIIIAAKTESNSSKIAKVMHSDLWGTKVEKLDFLNQASLDDGIFTEVSPLSPHYLFSNRNFAHYKEYEKGFSISEAMTKHSSGILTSRDHFVIDMDRQSLLDRICDFVNLDVEVARDRYNLRKDTRDWKISSAQDDAKPVDPSLLKKISFRPFDTRWTYYTGVSRGFMTNPRHDVMSQLVNSSDNIALTVTKYCKGDGAFSHVICHEHIADGHLTADTATVFPLFLTSDAFGLEQERKPNFSKDVMEKISSMVAVDGEGKVSPFDLFDYIYGVLHCPEYRKKYRDLLEFDFPRIPWPSGPEEFWKVVSAGNSLRGLHLMKDDLVDLRENEFPFRGEGDNVYVSKFELDNKRVKISKNQYFDDVSKLIWNFEIGGYKPAQKWLQQRKDKNLSYIDTVHYRKILKILSETSRIMNSISLSFTSES